MSNEKRGEFYSCKRMRLLNFLMERGFYPEATVPDPQNIKYKWWLFRNNKELETSISEYFSQYKKDA